MATTGGYEPVMIRAIWKNAPADTEGGWIDLPAIEIVALGLGALIVLWLLQHVIKSKRGNAGHLNDTSQGIEPYTIPKCRWRRDPWRRKQANMVRWVCSECGVEGYTHDGKKPKVCKRHLRVSVL